MSNEINPQTEEEAIAEVDEEKTLDEVIETDQYEITIKEGDAKLAKEFNEEFN